MEFFDLSEASQAKKYWLLALCLYFISYTTSKLLVFTSFYVVYIKCHLLLNCIQICFQVSQKIWSWKGYCLPCKCHGIPPHVSIFKFFCLSNLLISLFNMHAKRLDIKTICNCDFSGLHKSLDINYLCTLGPKNGHG
jgi:hypothetical protein